jgi:D-alanyl-D-alanine carboxypeptidase
MKRIIIYLSIIAILFSNTQYVQGEEEDKKVVEAIATYPEAPEINGHSGILIDIDTGAILYSKNAHEKMYPASITKIMTTLLAVENLAMEDTFTFTQDIINALPWDAAKYGYVAGEEVGIRDLIYVLMLRSANEVAIGLGMKIAGTEEDIIYSLASQLLIDEAEYHKMSVAVNPYGDGNASRRIADAILYHFGITSCRPVEWQ